MLPEEVLHRALEEVLRMPAGEVRRTVLVLAGPHTGQVAGVLRTVHRTGLAGAVLHRAADLEEVRHTFGWGIPRAADRTALVVAEGERRIAGLGTAGRTCVR